MSQKKLSASPTFRTAYDRVRWPGLLFTDHSRTKQAEMPGCDINNILRKFRATGQLPEMIQRQPTYGDFSEVGSYQEGLNTVLFAQEQFAALPAAVRKKFGNDPAAFLEFATDPANGREMVKMGLASERANPMGTPTKEEPKGPAKGPVGAQKGKSTPDPKASKNSDDE